MAAKPISEETKIAINADWRTGEYSQRQLAEKHKVSVGLVAKLTKGVAQDAKSIVSAGVEYLQGLQAHDERIVSAVEQVVDQKVRWLDFLNKAALKNVQEAMKVRCIDQKDFKDRAGTIGLAKDVIAGKNPEVAVQINNNGLGQLTDEELEARRIRAMRAISGED
jgi:predicted transcriptional regulator